MDSVDYCCKEHGATLAKIADLLSSPHHCRLLGKTMDALIKFRLSKGRLLDEVLAHFSRKGPLYCQLQTMYDPEYEKNPPAGYVICPLYIEDHKFYVKVILPPVERECDEHLIISAHEPEFPCPGEKK